LAAGDRIPFDALRDEPFIALPPEAGPAREFWLATDERQGDPVKLSNLLASRPEEFCLAVANGYGVCLTPESAHRFYPYPGVAYRPVDGIAPSLVSVVWRPDESEQIVNDFVDSCAELRQ
ncbi:MAG: LysR family transcriptional regulator, partial [Mycobacteriaceae bacterium]|nr:LysR family transcriptional regulator [Mycobacteriaceae bacterium]